MKVGARLTGPSLKGLGYEGRCKTDWPTPPSLECEAIWCKSGWPTPARSTGPPFEGLGYEAMV